MNATLSQLPRALRLQHGPSFRLTLRSTAGARRSHSVWRKANLQVVASGEVCMFMRLLNTSHIIHSSYLKNNNIYSDKLQLRLPFCIFLIFLHFLFFLWSRTKFSEASLTMAKFQSWWSKEQVWSKKPAVGITQPPQQALL